MNVAMISHMTWAATTSGISTLCAVITIGFTIFTWYRSNISKKAQQAAEEEAKLAKLHAESAQKIADSLRDLSYRLKGADLTLRWATSSRRVVGAHLCNNSPDKIVVARVCNPDDFMILRFPPLPFTIDPGQGVHVYLSSRLSLPDLVLESDAGVRFYVSLREHPARL